MKQMLVCVFLILMPITLLAEGKMDYYRDLVETYEDRVVPMILDRISGSDRAILRDIDFIFVENPAVITAVYTESDTKRVYIYAGFLDGLYNYIDCIFITVSSERRSACNDYFDYYFDHVVLKKPNPPVSFAENIYGDSVEFDSWLNNTETNEAKTVYMMSALIFIGMHEMGHHITGFAGPNTSVSEHRAIEARADRWAIDNLVRIGENPILGVAMSLGYLSQMERFRRIKEVRSLSYHPMPKSRAEYAFNKVCIGSLSYQMQSACDLIESLINEFE